MTTLTILLLAWSVSEVTGAQDPSQQLRLLAQTGQAESIRTLLAEAQELDVDSPDELGWTALMHAAKAGHDGVVRVLLEAGTYVGSRNDAGETALHVAARYGKAKVVQLLLEAGADFAVRDAEGRTPLYRAIEHKHADAIDLLQAAAQAEANRKRSMDQLAAEGRPTEAPKIVKSQPAPYTETALKKRIEGTVVLMVLVRRDGTIGGISVSKGVEVTLDRSALDTVRKWQFEPATRNGKPVDALLEIKIEFKPPKGS